MNNNCRPPAVVVGMCAHGLSIVRSLSLANIDVYALESDNSLPGVYTNQAKITFVPDINGSELVKSLIQFCIEKKFKNKPILFLSNDNMVAAIADGWSDLENYYQMSWGYCAAQLAVFLKKENIESRCDEVGLNYPDSQLIDNKEDIAKKKHLIIQQL